MDSPFLCSNPLQHNIIQFLRSPTGLHSNILLNPSPFPRCFFFLAPLRASSAALSTSNPHAAKLPDKSPKTECFFEKTFSGSPALEKEVPFTGFTPSRQGKEENNGNLKKSKEIKREKKGRKAKLKLEEEEFRTGLDMCSKPGDVLEALSLYEEAAKKDLGLQNNHYNVLCSSASAGFAYPEKNGSSVGDCGSEAFEADACLAQKEWAPRTNGGVAVRLIDDARAYAGRRGIEIYEKMSLEEFPMSEAAMTSAARMAMSAGDGDIVSEIVTFCSGGTVEKAVGVEKSVLELGLTSQEHELEALLRASVEAGRGEEVYHLLHKLRTIVRMVSPSTADVIDAWFRSSNATRVGKRKWDNQAVKEALENGGWGWHGFGWLGKGKWNVVRTGVDGEGVCLCCGEKLVAIDPDPIETEDFAECVESMVIKKERNTNFEKFQKWLEYYGPFEAVIDAANVGLFNQRRFSLIKVNAVANGIRQKLPSKKWPLIIIHNKRLLGGKMNEPFNKKLIEKWKNADAIYETPTGSNDDWYWLYAAIKCKSLVVTNDEMRDHDFQALGSDFFSKWKERHQVHFNHKDGSFQFIMPLPFSVVIQESERGHWHIPIAESEQGSNISWMCVTRASSHVISAASSNFFPVIPGDSATEITDLDAEASDQFNSSSSNDPEKRTTNSSQSITAAIKSPKSQIVVAIEDAEKIGGCIIDFEI